MPEYELHCFAQSGNAYRAALMLNLVGADWKPVYVDFFKGRIDGNLAIVNKRLEGRKFMLGDRPTIADVSLAGYLYYPAEEFGFDIAKEHPAIATWRERIKALPGWKHPYDLMPGHPIPA